MPIHVEQLKRQGRKEHERRTGTAQPLAGRVALNSCGLEQTSSAAAAVAVAAAAAAAVAVAVCNAAALLRAVSEAWGSVRRRHWQRGLRHVRRHKPSAAAVRQLLAAVATRGQAGRHPPPQVSARKLCRKPNSFYSTMNGKTNLHAAPHLPSADLGLPRGHASPTCAPHASKQLHHPWAARNRRWQAPIAA